MEKNYSETLNKAKTYFTNMIKEREKYMQPITLDLPKRIEIETLPVSTTEIVAKPPKTEIKKHPQPEHSAKSKSKASKKKSGNHRKQSNLKIESFDIINMNDNKTELAHKNESSSKSFIDSLSLSTNSSPVSTSLKVSTSSSTARINQKCHEAIEKAKNYFETRDESKLKKQPSNTKVNEATSIKVDENKKQIENNPVKTDTNKTSVGENHPTKKGKATSLQKKLAGPESLTPAKKYLRSKLGIDQKSINVKKERKESFRHSKTHVNRNATKIKTLSIISTKDSKKNVNQKETSKMESPQFGTQTVEQTHEHLTPAKRYLRSKFEIDDKNTFTRRDTKHNTVVQNISVNTEPKTASQPESSSKHGTKSHPISPVKVRQPLIRPVSRIRETNLKKLSVANETPKKAKPESKSISERAAELSTKTDIVTNIEPGSRETNILSIELKRSVYLTNSMEKLVSKALKIGLQKLNRSDLQDLQLKIKTSGQSRNNIPGKNSSFITERSDLVSLQSILETKISNFQTEMERRQKHTFDKIQELENTIQFRKQQLMEINKNKNKTLKNYEKNKPKT